GGSLIDPTRSIPEHGLAPFGNPADSWSPVALRPRLATGVLFRGAWLPRPRTLPRGHWDPIPENGLQRPVLLGLPGRNTAFTRPFRRACGREGPVGLGSLRAC